MKTMNTAEILAPTVEEILALELRRGTGDLPALPRACEAALELARSPKLEFSEVVAIAEEYPPLVARILSVVNSPLYWRGSHVTGVKPALVRMGLQTVRDILYQSVYASTLFDAPPYEEWVEDSFRHGVLVARTARRLAVIRGMDDDVLFLAGLLHDIGVARCLKLASRKLRHASREELTRAIDRLHMRAGAELACAWRLPPEVEEACLYHEQSDGPPAAMVVALADTIVDGATGARPLQPERVKKLMERVGIDVSRLVTLVEMAVDDARTLRAKTADLPPESGQMTG
jgi:HD-like signal output (HDOD) protein